MHAGETRTNLLRGLDQLDLGAGDAILDREPGDRGGDEERGVGLAAVYEQHPVDDLVHRLVEVAVRDHVDALREVAEEHVGLELGAAPRGVQHPDAHPIDLDDLAVRQRAAHFDGIRVSVDDNGALRGLAKAFDDVEVDDVTAVEGDVRLRNRLADARMHVLPAADVGVAHDEDPGHGHRGMMPAAAVTGDSRRKPHWNQRLPWIEERGGCMTLEQRLIDLERAGWDALTKPGEGARFYDEHLSEDALMVFGFGVLDRAQAIEAMAAAPPWAWFRIEQTRVIVLTEDSAVLTYLATAKREAAGEYAGRTTSVYVLRGERWKMALHQQTPAV